jgi:hypothetical protein
MKLLYLLSDPTSGLTRGADAQIVVVQGMLTRKVPLTSTATHLFVMFIKAAYRGPRIRDGNIV